MQGKALAALAGLLVLAFAGCGDGDNPSSVDGTSSGSSATAEAGQSPSPSAAQLKRLRDQVRKLRLDREKKEGSRPGKAAAGDAAPSPNVVHHDSGGGAAQFRTKGGDNSIQESGVEASSEERERAAMALHAYLDLRAAHRWATACEYMSSSLVVLLERAVSLSPGRAKPEGCPAVLAAMSKAAPQRLLEELAEVDVGSLRLSGERGLLLYHGPQGKDYVMVVVKEAGEWRMASLDGTVLP